MNTTIVERTPMHPPTDLQERPAFPAPAEPFALVSGERPVVFSRSRPAANDVDGEGRGATIDPIARSKPGAHEPDRAARATRSYAIREILAAIAMAAVDFARDVRARQLRRRRARAIREAFAELDGRTLRDLGLDRSEIDSLASEVTGDAERTRTRAVLAATGFLP